MIKELLHDLLHLVYPHLCVGCQEEPVDNDELFCVRCESKLPLTDFHQFGDNEALRRISNHQLFKSGTSMFRFYPGGIVQKMIHEIKYKAQTNIALRLGKRYGILLSNAMAFKEIDCVIPVPLHPIKQRQRGFNQSKFFAEGLATSMQKHLYLNMVRRVMHTDTQTGKNRYERLKSIMYAFEKGSAAAHLQNKHVLLVDDVLTTGATLESCATALSSIRGIKLSFATIALAQ